MFGKIDYDGGELLPGESIINEFDLPHLIPLIAEYLSKRDYGPYYFSIQVKAERVKDIEALLAQLEEGFPKGINFYELGGIRSFRMKDDPKYACPSVFIIQKRQPNPYT